MTNEAKYKEYQEYRAYKQNSVLAEEFKSSEKTISRWNNEDSPIPDYVIVIIDLQRELNKSERIIDNLNMELTGFRQSIHNFKSAYKRLFDDD